MSSVVASSVVMDEDLTELDAAGLLAASSAAVRARRLAEVHDLEVLAQWAAVHPAAGRSAWDSLCQLGGEGTPLVQEFCLGEIALARGTGYRDAQRVGRRPGPGAPAAPDLGGVQAGEAEVYIARRVAKLSRHLSAERCRSGGPRDRRDHRPRVRWAGPRGRGGEDHRGRPRAAPGAGRERTPRRYVSSSRTDEFGLRTLIARSRPATWSGSRPSWPGSRRSSRPATPTPPPTSSARSRSAGSPDPPNSSNCCWSTATRKTSSTSTSTTSRATAFPADLLDALRDVDLSPLAPKAVLYVHLHEAASTASGGVARVEGIGPVTLTGAAGAAGRGPTDGQAGASTCPTGSGPPPMSTPSRSRNGST